MGASDATNVTESHWDTHGLSRSRKSLKEVTTRSLLSSFLRSSEAYPIIITKSSRSPLSLPTNTQHLALTLHYILTSSSVPMRAMILRSSATLFAFLYLRETSSWKAAEKFTRYYQKIVHGQS